FNNGSNVNESPFRRAFLASNVEIRGGNPGPNPPAQNDLPSRQMQLCQLAVQMLLRNARIQERPHDHVAACARKTIKVSDAHSNPRLSVPGMDPEPILRVAAFDALFQYVKSSGANLGVPLLRLPESEISLDRNPLLNLSPSFFSLSLSHGGIKDSLG